MKKLRRNSDKIIKKTKKEHETLKKQRRNIKITKKHDNNEET